MEANSFENLSRSILAEIVRTSLASALVNEDSASQPRSRRSKAVAPVGDDLVAHLRGIRRWLITREVAAVLHFHTETVYRKIKHQDLPAQKDNGRLKFDPAKIAEWIEARTPVAGDAQLLVKKGGRA